MTFNKIFDAYKEAIFASVDKREYDTVEILNTSMKLLSDSLNTKEVNTIPTITPETVTSVDNYESGMSYDEIHAYVIELASKGTIKSTDAVIKYYNKFHSKFTPYDYEVNHKGEPRWKSRFWNATHQLRKSKVFMPNVGKFANRYAINPDYKAEN
jgi:hypothetical protein